MNLSVKLITALVAFVLLVVGLVALTSSGSTARAAVDANVYVANEWSKLTNDPTPLTGYKYAGSGKTIYSTFVEVADVTGAAVNTTQSSSDTLTIFVEDADVNVAVPKSKTTLNTTTGQGQSKIVVLTSVESPIVDVDGDGDILDDISIIAPAANTDISGSFTLSGAFAGTAAIDASITVVQSAAGGAPGVGGGKFGLSWKTSAINTLIVKVATTQDTTGKTFSISETGPSTGKFKGSITLRDVQNSAPWATRIAIQSGGVVTVTYSDATPKTGAVAKSVTSTATTETGAPLVTTTAPVNGSATQVRRPAFTGSVTDTTSGLDVSGILVYIDESDDAADAGDVAATKGSTVDDNSPTTPTASIDGVSTSTFAFTPAADLPLGFTSSTPDHIVDWQVQASDLAGNIGWSDSNATTVNTLGRGQDNTVKIDRTLPGITNAYTGFRLDSTTTPALRKVNSATSLEIDFNDVMDAETIQNTDFEVKVGSVTQVPTEAAVGSKGFTDSVFLTLGTALATKDKPTVTIVNSISDAAGNTTSTGSKVAKDALAPTLTVALTGGSSATAPATLTKLKMTITITSDENLSADPTVAIYTAASDSVVEGTVTAVNQGGNVWIASFSGGSFASAKKTVYVTALDAAATVSQAGAGAAADGVLAVPATATIGQTISGKKATAATGALTFTLDKVAPTLTLSPTGTTSDASPFIRWDFGEKVTVSKAEFGLSAATLADVTTELGTSDTQVYVRATSGLALGLYKATGTATDLAGNKATGLSSTFTIAKRVEFKLTVLPGTTLVSFPLTPADTSINSVFSPAGIVSVSSYDSAAGTFTSAVRDAESGDLAGDLASVGSGIGYVVVADAVSALVVPIPSLTASSIPPTITVLKGWSLVGVTDVVGDASGALRQPGSSIMAGTSYFPAKVTQVYSWNPTSKIWQALTTRPGGDGGANVVAGEAYWAYATADDVIVP